MLYKCIDLSTILLKGTCHDFIFQSSLFSTLADIFTYLETSPYGLLNLYQSSHTGTTHLVQGSQLFAV